MKTFLKKHFATIVTLMLILVAISGIVVSYGKTVKSGQKFEEIKALGNGPKAVLDMTDYDWGDIERDKIAEKEFVLKNIGKSDLEISKIMTSCGCTTADLFINKTKIELPARISPGTDAMIFVQFDPEVMDSRGEIKRAVRIETNDPDNPFLIINLKANVK